MDDIKKLSVTEMGVKIEELTKDVDTRKLFEDEMVNGDAFLMLTKGDLREMRIKWGPRKFIERFLDSLKPTTEPAALANVNLCRRCADQTLNISIADEHSSAANAALTTSFTAQHPSSLITKDLCTRYVSLEETLRGHQQGKPLLAAIRRSLFTEDDRRSLIRILVGELIKCQNSHYPDEAAKINLAASIVQEFPLLRDSTSKLGYEHLYDPETKKGFIEYRLWECRKSLPADQKKYKTKGRKRSFKSKCKAHSIPDYNFNQENLLDNDNFENQVHFMKHKVASDSAKTSIYQAMEKTYPNRRVWIEESFLTINDIFEKFPRLADYNGGVIDAEFERMHNGASNRFLVKFTSFYVPRILKYCERARKDLFKKSLNIDDDNLRAIAVLAALLPTSNSVKSSKRTKSALKGVKRGRVERTADSNILEKAEVDTKIELNLTDRFPNPSLIQIFYERTSLTDAIKEIREKSKGPIQPHIISISGQAPNYFVQAGQITLTPPSNCPVMALDLLFKLLFVLNVRYASSLEYFFNFLENYCYKLKGSQPYAAVTSMHISIGNTLVESLSNDSESNTL